MFLLTLPLSINISMKSSSRADYKYVEIFQQCFVVVGSQDDEKYALCPNSPIFPMKVLFLQVVEL